RAYIGISEYSARMLRSATSNPVVRIDNASPVVGSRKIKVRTGEKVAFLMVGRLVHEKNIELLLRSASLIQSKCWTLRIAGDGPRAESLHALAASLSLADRVSFIGSISNVQAEYELADVFLMSSRSEGLPISLIEATLS